MRCRVHRSAATSLWPVLLDLRRLLSVQVAPALCPSLQLGSDGWHLVADAAAAPTATDRVLLPLTADRESATTAASRGATVFSYGRFLAGDDPFIAGDRQLDEPLRTILRLYLPGLIGGHLARRAGRLFVIAHLAQSLDGRIACHNGQSQWISNEANLHHAHRLRALNDAVMVGTRTIQADDPQLTVRHVRGDNPRRVVLNASGSVVRHSEKYRVCSGAGGLFLCRTDTGELPPLNGANEVVRLRRGESPFISPDEVAKALIQRGIHSVFLEGGGRSVSQFLQARSIDILHLHIAPRILGSGVPSFDLPEVMRVDASLSMPMEHFSMGGELLFECRRSVAQE